MAKVFITRKEIERAVNEILLEVIVTLNENNLRPDAKLTEDLGADSLDVMEACMHMEKTFGITITDYQMNEMGNYTVEQVCDMVEKMV